MISGELEQEIEEYRSANDIHPNKVHTQFLYGKGEQIVARFRYAR